MADVANMNITKTPALLNLKFFRARYPKEYSVIMRTSMQLAVFSAEKILNFSSKIFTQPFEKFLTMLDRERPIFREIFWRISKSNEAAVLPRLHFVHNADGPHGRPLKSASNTATAGHIHAPAGLLVLNPDRTDTFHLQTEAAAPRHEVNPLNFLRLAHEGAAGFCYFSLSHLLNLFLSSCRLTYSVLPRDSDIILDVFEIESLSVPQREEPEMAFLMGSTILALT